MIVYKLYYIAIVFFVVVCINVYAQENNNLILETLPLQPEQNEYIANNKEEWDKQYKELSQAYKAYQSKAIIAPSNIILCNIPGDSDLIERETEKQYPIDSRTIIDNNKTVEHGKVSLQINLFQNSNYALMNTLFTSFARAKRTARLSTWNGADFIKTPFDFTFNYCGGKMQSLIVSYFNAKIFINIHDSNLKDPLPLSELDSVFSFISSLFQGYKTRKSIEKKQYFTTTTSIVKDKWNPNGTTFKVICDPDKRNNSLIDKNWILAVSNIGTLSVDNISFNYKKIRDKANREDFYFVSTDINDKNRYYSIPSNPISVYLKLPEGEKTAELIFYFISEDGKQYSSQSITLTVPETEKESTSTK